MFSQVRDRGLCQHERAEDLRQAICEEFLFTHISRVICHLPHLETLTV
jgi:hypothetical protein